MMNKNIQRAELCLDHREIGQEQDLFSFQEAGPGLPFFHPKGLILKNILIDYWRKQHQCRGYEEIESPMLLDKDLWVQSGHWDLYRENMYISEVEKRDFAVKPMNCPGAMLYYKNKKRSFKELPLRVCEMGRVHRNESSGALHGLLRVRSFIVDDAHIFCAEEQLKAEIKNFLNLCLQILGHCGFKAVEFELSVRGIAKGSKYLGKDQDWQVAEQALEDSLKDLKLKYQRIEGEAKFYGPAIDIKIKDSAGRKWQCSSLQMDFNLAHRFNLCFFDRDGKRQIPFILHRCIYGSLERFIGMLLEHYQGRLPLWLTPVQVRILSVGSDMEEHINSIERLFYSHNIRFDRDICEDNLSGKVKRAREEFVPYVLLIGKKEVESQNFSLKKLRDNGEQKSLSPKELCDFFRQ